MVLLLLLPISCIDKELLRLDIFTFSCIVLGLIKPKTMNFQEKKLGELLISARRHGSLSLNQQIDEDLGGRALDSFGWTFNTVRDHRPLEKSERFRFDLV